MAQQLTPADIDALLDKDRPDRYSVGDRDWRKRAYNAVATRLPVARARAIAAEAIVDQREGVATRAANALLRDIGRTRQWPFDWLDFAARPISIGNERVCLRAALAKDFEQWAIDERRDAAQEFSARSTACDGAEWLAKQMRDNGWSTFEDAAIANTRPESAA